MGSALDRLIAEHGGGGATSPPDHPSALDALIAQHAASTPDISDRIVAGLKSAGSTVGNFIRGVAEPFVNVATVPLKGEATPDAQGHYDAAQEGFAAKLGINLQHPDPSQEAFIHGGGTQTPRQLAASAVGAAAQEALPGPIGKLGELAAPLAEPIASKLAGSAAGRIASRAIASSAEGAVFGGGASAASGAVRDLAPGETRAQAIASDAASGAKGGAVAGGVLGGAVGTLGEGAKAVSDTRDIRAEANKPAAILSTLSPEDRAHVERDPALKAAFTNTPEDNTPGAALGEPDGEVRRRITGKVPPPVEPGPDAATVSAGGSEEPDALDKLIATRQYLGPRGQLDDVGEVGRRPAGTLPIEQRLPVEPPPDAQTVSYGGRIGRRPGVLVAPEAPLPETPVAVEPARAELPPPVENPRLETYSTPEPEPALRPIVSSNGTLEARPGVIRRVNSELNGAPEPTRPFTATFGPEDVSGAAERPDLASEPRDVPAQELLNKTTLDTDPDGSKALSEELDRLKGQGLDKKTVSFETQRRAAQDFADNLNIDRLTLDPAKYGRLSGAEIVGLKNVLTQNLNMMGELSKQMADENLSTGETELLGDRLDKLRDQNDALLSKIVKESSEKGRDLGFLRQMSNGTLDPDAWVVTAKRLAGDAVLDDAKIAKIRRLAKEAADACGVDL